MFNKKNGQAPVKVTADEDGRVVVPSRNNPDMGYIRVESTADVLNEESGFINEQTRSALIKGRIEKLKSFDVEEGQNVGGKIIVKEQTTPFYDEQEPKINPQTGKVLLKDGQPIYRNTFWTNNEEAENEYVQHTSEGEQIAEPQEQEEMEATASITG